MRAIKDYQGPLKEHEVRIFVRRGGPNYQEGLRVMGEVGKNRARPFVLASCFCHLLSAELSQGVKCLTLVELSPEEADCSCVLPQGRPRGSPSTSLARRPT